MSNTKVTVSDYKLRQLQNATRDAQIKIRARQDEADRYREELKREREAYKLEKRCRNDGIKTMLGEISVDFESSVNSSALDENEKTNARNSVKEKLAAIEASLDDSKNNITDIKSNLSVVSDNFNNLLQTVSTASSEERASLFAKQLESYLERIEKLEPESFYPEEYEVLKTDLKKSRGNIAVGDYSAAVAGLQDSLTDAIELVSKLVADNALCADTKAEAQTKISELLEKTEFLKDKYNTAIVVEGQEYDYDIQKYSRGLFGDIVKSVNELNERLNNLSGADKLNSTTAALKEALQLEKQLESCEKYARDEFASYMAVRLMSSKLCQLMDDNAWELNSAGYVNQDETGSSIMNFSDGSGNEVTMTVIPDGETIQPTFCVEAFPQDGNPESGERIKAVVLSELGKQGIQSIGEAQVDTNCHLYRTPDEFEKHISGVAQNSVEDKHGKLKRSVLEGEYN